MNLGCIYFFAVYFLLIPDYVLSLVFQDFLRFCELPHNLSVKSFLKKCWYVLSVVRKMARHTRLHLSIGVYLPSSFVLKSTFSSASHHPPMLGMFASFFSDPIPTLLNIVK